MLKTLFPLFLLALTGCTPILTADLVAALAKDEASFCAHVDLHGGAGGGAITPVPVVPMIGYGSTTLSFCRSNHAGAEVRLAPDGSVSITHK